MKKIIALLLVNFLWNMPASAINLDLSSVPLFLGSAVEPNVMFTLDDSGSMQWEIMPDENMHATIHVFPRPSGLYGGIDYPNQVPNFDDNNVHNFFGRSSTNNAVFYNPDITYVPWSNADGISMGDANPSSALYNPDLPGLGSLNLTAQQTQVATWFSHPTSLTRASCAPAPCGADHTYWPITYYTYNGGSVTDRASYTRVRITGATPAGTIFTSPNGTVRTRDEEIQNFANWFQYYRSRILAARAGVGRAFARQGGNMRVGFAAINQDNKTIDGVNSSRALINGLRPFSGTDRSDFFDRLYGRVLNQSGTPLRSALNSVGQYFERTDNNGPWSELPGANSSADHLICRQSYNILMTDGFWNGGDPSVGNSDNTNGTTITGPNNPDFQYVADEPYKDDWSNTLADVGMEYWKKDLRTDLANDVPTNADDPAFWQHLVNFTVGLGVTGNLDPDHDLPDLTNGTLTWADPAATGPAKIDDLWHTALNSRGGFFSAADPDTFADSLSAILNAITARTSSASSVALNSGTVSGTSKLYQARFNSGDWTGQLLAFPINADGTLGAKAWDAGSLIPVANLRTVITYDGTDGQAFRWADISAPQQTLLGDVNVLNYLRGDQSGEVVNGGSFRNRNALLGDIINSSPTYVGAPSARYPDNWGTGAAENSVLYSTFKSTNSSRQPMIYAGANDGMLHAFNADTGVELFAYIPQALFPRLADLSSTSYNHRYYVDGSPTVVDAFFAGAWHTVMIGSLGGGGQGIFALDVTDPSNFSNEASAKNKVLWEFTDDDDRDLGYTFGQPSIVRLNNGKWAAVFSGGYNNTHDDDNDGGTTNDSLTGDAMLYIVDLEDGSLIKKFDTKVGMAEDPTTNNRPNGLASPAVVDLDNNYTADAIYAGDLFGNVWKIDISGNAAGSWKFSYRSGADPLPIFTACAGSVCDSTNSQPITTQVQVVRHPNLSGYLLVFGTGKYIEIGDNSAVGQTTQSFYAIWDKVEASLTRFDRNDLLEQEIILELTVPGNDVRITTENQVDWTTHLGWYLDLFNTQAGNTDNNGERVTSNAVVRNGRVIFTTLLPSTDPCEFGGSGWLMELDLNSGARLEYSPFDINGDSVFTRDDFVNIGDIDGDGQDDYVPVSGKKSKVGIIPRPSITQSEGGQKEYKYTSGSTGTIEVTVENPGPSFGGRQSWRELDFIFR
ncbi:MAG: PilC/PilY family type IV pilus protein [Gammaproteobacteria bacterium]|nr:PilC/PilY family type IV pilus protein [Gammaproteobacteria bacterium]